MKLATIIIVFLTYVNGDLHNVTVESLTHVTSGFTFDSSILKTHNQIVYVSYEIVNADLTIKVESDVIPRKRNNTCEIIVSPSEQHHLSAPKATLLGNGKLVVAVIEASSESGELNTTQLNLKISVIDLFDNCTHNDFSVVFDDRILSFFEPFSLIPYQDTFDIFAASNLHCKSASSICLIRYNDKGDHHTTLDFDFLTGYTSFDLVKIYPINEFDSSAGYIFTSQYTSTMKRLDDKLKVIKEVKLADFILSVSVLNGDIGVCFQVDDPISHTKCNKYDERLKLKSSVNISNPRYSIGRKVFNLMDGSSLYTVIKRGNVDTTVRRLTADGKISEPEFYHYDCESSLTDTKVQFVELKSDIYCFNFWCKHKAITHCVKSPNAKFLSVYMK